MNKIVEKEPKNKPQGTESSVKIIYFVYLVSSLFIPFVGFSIAFVFLMIIGVIMAYINYDDASDYLKTHYQLQIRTFWIGSPCLLIIVILFKIQIIPVVVLGYLLFLFWFIWIVIRCVKGLKYLDYKEKYLNPTGWLF